jgi:diguanylate cyclase (GGDEF)-like protein
MWVLLGLAIIIGVPILRNRALKRRARLLEQKVAEQTVELTEAVAKLAFANECLDLMSRNDALTGIPNRRQFDERLQEEWARGRRARTPVGFILIDLDHFKALNDSQGHYAGDMALKKIGDFLHSSMRRTGDLVARLGGEEFAVILPNTRIDGCSHLAEQLRDGIEKLEILHDDAPSRVLTASFGVTSVVPGEEQSPADLLVAADRALYRAKANGRNRVESEVDETEVDEAE